MDHLQTLQGIPVLAFAIDGPKLDDRSVNDFIGLAWGSDAQWLVIPLERLAPGFLDLSTRIAGEVIQKFTNYRVGVAFIGNIAPWTQASNSLRDFVYESNKGGSVWFMRDQAEFAARIQANA